MGLLLNSSIHFFFRYPYVSFLRKLFTDSFRNNLSDSSRESKISPEFFVWYLFWKCFTGFFRNCRNASKDSFRKLSGDTFKNSGLDSFIHFYKESKDMKIFYGFLPKVINGGPKEITPIDQFYNLPRLLSKDPPVLYTKFTQGNLDIPSWISSEIAIFSIVYSNFLNNNFNNSFTKFSTFFQVFSSGYPPEIWSGISLGSK